MLLHDPLSRTAWPEDDWDTANRACVLADDDQLLLAYLAGVFRQRGYEVSTATDGATALRLVRERKPAFVLLDVSMPGLDGWQVLRALRQAGGTRDTPVLMLTARAGAANVSKAITSGADDYITKPIMPKDLVDRVHQVLDQRL